MAKKEYTFIFDSETTQDQKVADFAGVVVDRHGNIYTQIAVLVKDIFNDRENHPLFYHGDADPLWGKATLPARYDRYDRMLESGTRMLASVPAINSWLAKAKFQYDPIITAYNLAFDVGKCENTAIDLTIFDKRFCLWYASFTRWAKSKKYRDFVLQNHFFGNRTDFGNMSYRTTAEHMARFVLGNPELEDEPHTALEDVIDYELPIFRSLVKNYPKKKWMNPDPYNWRELQLRDWFKAK